MHSATLHYDKPLLRRAVRRFWWRVVGARFVVALALCAAALAMLVRDRDLSWHVGALASVLAIGIGFVVALYVVHYRGALRKLRSMGAPHATLVASEESLTLASGAGSATLPWSAVAEVWRFDSLWLLLFSRAQFATLPLADLAPETAAFILERVRQAGGKVD